MAIWPKAASALLISALMVHCERHATSSGSCPETTATAVTPAVVGSAPTSRFAFHDSCNVSLAASGGYVSINALVTETVNGEKPMDFIWSLDCHSLDGRWGCFGSRLAVDGFEKGDVSGIDVSNFVESDMRATVSAAGVTIREMVKQTGGGSIEHARIIMTHDAAKSEDVLRVSYRVGPTVSRSGTTTCVDALDWK